MKNSQVARNLLSTTAHSFTGAVSSTSRVPVRFSSANSRMVSSGTRSISASTGNRANEVELDDRFRDGAAPAGRLADQPVDEDAVPEPLGHQDHAAEHQVADRREEVRGQFAAGERDELAVRADAQRDREVRQPQTAEDQPAGHQERLAAAW